MRLLKRRILVGKAYFNLFFPGTWKGLLLKLAPGRNIPILKALKNFGWLIGLGKGLLWVFQFQERF